jgi:hypothetical protein
MRCPHCAGEIADRIEQRYDVKVAGACRGAGWGNWLTVKNPT